MTESKLFCVLPDYVCTPDGMAIDRYGNLVLSCPNYAQDDLSGWGREIAALRAAHAE